MKQLIKSSLQFFPPAWAAAEKLRQSVVWLQWRLNRRPHPPGALRLHMGCGDIDVPGFVNLDARPKPHVHHVQRIDKLKAFNNDSAELIYGSHCLEHVSHRQTLAVLKEWHRVLRPGGTIRLSVPDFDLLVDTYLDNQREMASVILPLMGSQDYPFNFHCTAFTERSLADILVQAGFKSPRRWQHGADPFRSLPDWSGRSMTYKGKTYAVSLNMEADK
jgi:predicted SAM-dependent methyltransferase